MEFSVEQIVQKVVQAAHKKKALDIRVLDIRGLSMVADYFVICSGNSRTQVEAITEAIEEELEQAGVSIQGLEGKEGARWVLIDLGDIVVHVFHRDDREFYQLEHLWGDAPSVEPLLEEVERVSTHIKILPKTE
ncbi:MAG: ribosome silencing factor [Bacillus thermozeamaize]|uniref:Ribosomal silencing factor RsfS n=1 Tax=Bacillus thermozeamaize TaxID=230954 RepID=A0A1Y3PSM5_9BACI|nr:MAG: ribosome silencing factor [Bacillus thermozeamaize]